MKKILQIFAIAISTVILSSCGGSGGKISSVKLIPVKSGKEFQYVDLEGKVVINPQFANASVFKDGLALVQASGTERKWGYISEDGKYVINTQFKEATIFSDGMAWTVMENAAPSAIDNTGRIVFTMQDAENVRIFKEGLAAYSVINDEGEIKWGFVDKTGKIKINPQFSEAGDFSDGRCAVKNPDRKWGYIDKEGKIIINYQFDGADSFKNGKAVVESSDKKGLIDQDGKYIINPQFSNMIIDGNMFLIDQGGKWGWCDEDGKITINPQFGEAFPFLGNSITSVQSGDNYGYIDKDGKIIINPQFDMALPFNGNLALVVTSDKVGFIDKDGRYVINPQYDDVSKDLILYMLYGSSAYDNVNTDYFNVGAITSALNFESPEGFTFNSTFTDVMQKYGLGESSFNKYGTEHLVNRNLKITNDAYYDFYVIGSAFTVTTSGGWYSYNIYTFNGGNKPDAYAYAIRLSNKGYGKEEAVIAAIQKKLTGYTKDESGNYYSDGKRQISIFENRGSIVVSISTAEAGDV
jgi:hypothetical protein